jgi:hypothetical protein
MPRRYTVNVAGKEIAVYLAADIEARIGADAPSYGVFTKHMTDELNEAHRVLDNLGVSKTKRVRTRNGDGDQDIAIGLRERIVLLQQGREQR